MANESFKVKKSLNIEPLASPNIPDDGDIGVNSTTDKLVVRLDGQERQVVTASSSGELNLVDNNTLIVDNGDSTKKVKFEVSSVTTATTRTLTVPDSDGTLTLNAAAQTLTNKSIDADSNTITNIEDADIKAGAAIARNKLASGTANRLVVNDGTGVMVSAAAITAARALISDANGIPTQSTVTSTELGHLSGVTSAIQTQLGGKVDDTGDALTGSLTFATSTGIESTAAASTLNIGTGSNTTSLNIGTGSTTQSINIGTGAGTTTINIGGAGDTVNISGTLAVVNTTNLDVVDKLIVLNDGGAAASGDNSGFQIEEGGVNTGYIKTGGSRSLWLMKVPATAGEFAISPAAFTTTLTASSTAVRNVTLPDATTTLLGTATTQVVTNKDIDGGTASNTSRLTVPKAAKTDLDGLTRKEATLVYASDEDKLYVDNGTTLVQVGSGGNYVVSANLTLAASGSITLTADGFQTWRVQGNSAAVTLATTPFGASAPLLDGTTITLIGNSDTNTVTLTNQDIAKGAVLNGNATLTRFRSITLQYNAAVDRYIELNRNF